MTYILLIHQGDAPTPRSPEVCARLSERASRPRQPHAHGKDPLARSAGGRGQGNFLERRLAELAMRKRNVSQPRLEVVPIGTVESSLTDPASAPKQGDEGAPEAWLVFEPTVLEALDGIRAGDEVVVLTWLDRACRDVLRVHPRDDPSRPEQGVFSTRSPDRPNPIGLHRVEIASVDGRRVRVRNLEAVNGTPIVDVKPLLSSDIRKR